jgi:hypothetical protein
VLGGIARFCPVPPESYNSNYDACRSKVVDRGLGTKIHQGGSESANDGGTKPQRETNKIRKVLSYNEQSGDNKGDGRESTLGEVMQCKPSQSEDPDDNDYRGY